MRQHSRLAACLRVRVLISHRVCVCVCVVMPNSPTSPKRLYVRQFELVNICRREFEYICLPWTCSLSVITEHFVHLLFGMNKKYFVVPLKINIE